jgi:hypothetical protein
MHERDTPETRQDATPRSSPRTGRAPQPAVPRSEPHPAPRPSQRERVQLSLLLCPDSAEQPRR